MEVILLERVPKLGQMGEIVRVKDGYARNFLLPQKKALRATKANLAAFEARRATLEARNLEQKQEAEGVAQRLNGESYIAIRQAGDTGLLYGSVTSRDIAELITENGTAVERRQVRLDSPIKELGVHSVGVSLHPEVEVTVTINVARSQEEAERQARGEDVSMIRDEELDIETYDPDADGDFGYGEAGDSDAAPASELADADQNTSG